MIETGEKGDSLSNDLENKKATAAADRDLTQRTNTQPGCLNPILSNAAIKEKGRKLENEIIRACAPYIPRFQRI